MRKKGRTEKKANYNVSRNFARGEGSKGKEKSRNITGGGDGGRNLLIRFLWGGEPTGEPKRHVEGGGPEEKKKTKKTQN